MLDPKRQLSVMFGAPVTCVSPIQRPRIESFDKTEPKRPRVQSFDTDGRREGLELHEGLYDGLPPPKNCKVPVVTPKVPVMAAMPEAKRPPMLRLDDDESCKRPKLAVPPPPPPPRCGECGDDIDAMTDLAMTRCRGSVGCANFICDGCHEQSRKGQLRKLAPALRDSCASPRGQATFRALLQESWSGGRVCEACLDKLEKRLDEDADDE